jgi:hypothetical protein
VGFVVNEVALEQVFLRVLLFPLPIFSLSLLSTHHHSMRCAVILTASWVIAQCSLAEVDIALMMEAVNFYKTKRRNILEGYLLTMLNRLLPTLNQNYFAKSQKTHYKGWMLVLEVVEIFRIWCKAVL